MNGMSVWLAALGTRSSGHDQRLDLLEQRANVHQTIHDRVLLNAEIIIKNSEHRIQYSS